MILRDAVPSWLEERLDLCEGCAGGTVMVQLMAVQDLDFDFREFVYGTSDRLAEGLLEDE